MTSLHHVSLPVRDLDRSHRFYRKVIGLAERQRPEFAFPGAWFAMEDRQMHLIVNPKANFRTRPVIDALDIHHAYRIADFEQMLARLESHGYRPHQPKGYDDENHADERMHVAVYRSSPAGFLQAFLLDPDWHFVELNTAPFPQ